MAAIEFGEQCRPAPERPRTDRHVSIEPRVPGQRFREGPEAGSRRAADMDERRAASKRIAEELLHRLAGAPRLNHDAERALPRTDRDAAQAAHHDTSL
jgi:hypothetical protein